MRVNRPGGFLLVFWLTITSCELVAGLKDRKPAPLQTLSLLAGGLGGPGWADGTGGNARFNTPFGIASDGAGDLFVADGFNNVIRKVAIATGVVTTVAGSVGIPGGANGTGAAATFFEPSGLTIDGGNLFVADYENDTIRKIVIATGVVTAVAGSVGVSGLADGTGEAATFNRPTGLAVDGAGNLFVADSANNSIRKIVIATGVVSTVAGSPTGVSGSEDGPGESATFNSPVGLAADGAGNLFVADWGNDTIRQFVIATGVVTTIAGSAGVPGFADGLGVVAATFNNPAGLVFDGAGNLFVADNANDTIRQFVIATGVVSTIAGSKGVPGSADGSGVDATLSNPWGLASDGAGSLFVTDTTDGNSDADDGNGTIRQFVIATRLVTTFAGSPGESGGMNGTGAAARFYSPAGAVSDGAGNLFVADWGNGTIRKIVIATGGVTTVAGAAGTLGSHDGTGADALFNSPWGLASDGAGNLFVADFGNNAIRKFVIATGAVTTVAGSAAGSGYTDGIGAEARFSSPTHVASDGAGNLFVADSDNDTIRKFVIATGVVSTVAGKPQSSGAIDGAGGDALFYDPNGLASDGAGNLFVADSGNDTIRKVVIATGVVSTVAGYAGAPGNLDGVGVDARFNDPTGLVSDGAGNLLIADQGNHVIRRFVIASGAVSTLVGSPPIAAVIPGPLPAALNGPRELAAGTAGSFFITDENAVLQVQ